MTNAYFSQSELWKTLSTSNTHTHKLVKCNYSSQGNCAEKKLFCFVSSLLRRQKKRKWAFFVLYLSIYIGHILRVIQVSTNDSVSPTVLQYGIIFFLRSLVSKLFTKNNNKTNKKEILKSQFFLKFSKSFIIQNNEEAS